MTIRTRPAAMLFLASVLTLPGCYGTSEDKGDNGDSKLITPKPSTIEDANTAGSRTSPLPDPAKGRNAPTAMPTDGAK